MKTKLLFNLNFLLFLTIITISCNQKNEQKDVYVKNIFYKVYAGNDSLIGFALREYKFSKDTITENFLTIDIKGRETDKYKNTFFKRGKEIFVFSKMKNDNRKFLYFKPTVKDTCFYINRKMDSFYLCSKGKVNFKGYKNVFKLHYDERGYDTVPKIIILDEDYTILSIEYDSYLFPRKEIIVKDDEISNDIKLKLQKASKEILWW